MAREKGGKPGEDASFKSLLARLDNGLERSGADAAARAAPPVMPLPPNHAPGLNLQGLPSQLSALPAARAAHLDSPHLGHGSAGSLAVRDLERVTREPWSRRSPGLIWASFAGGLSALGAVWLVATYWSISQQAGPRMTRQAVVSAPDNVESREVGDDTASTNGGMQESAVSTSLAPTQARADTGTASLLPTSGSASSATVTPLREPEASSAGSAAVPVAVEQRPMALPSRRDEPLARQMAAQEVAPSRLSTEAPATSPERQHSAPPPPPETKLLVAPTSRAQAGESAPFAVKVEAPGQPVERLHVVITGLPTGAFLSAGIAKGQGAWQVPVRGLDSLLLRLPIAAREDVPLGLELQDATGNSLARAATLIAVMPAALPPQDVSRAAPPPPPSPAAAVTSPPPSPAPSVSSPPAQPQPPRLTMDEGTAMIERGRLLARTGDIAGARHLFERAADAGSGRAALLMGETYDPDVLANMRVMGVRGDLAKARHWYARASELGTVAATERLKALAGR